eukprot:3363188-Amphidinium_carterae.1
MPVYMGSFVPPLCPVLPMPWYACQSSGAQQLRKLDSSSSSSFLQLPKSDSKQSMDAASSDANVGEEQGSEGGKVSKRKHRRGRHSVWQSAREEAESEPTT